MFVAFLVDGISRLIAPYVTTGGGSSSSHWPAVVHPISRNGVVLLLPLRELDCSTVARQTGRGTSSLCYCNWNILLPQASTFYPSSCVSSSNGCLANGPSAKVTP
jgi:hypothetical protein